MNQSRTDQRNKMALCTIQTRFANANKINELLTSGNMFVTKKSDRQYMCISFFPWGVVHYSVEIRINNEVEFQFKRLAGCILTFRSIVSSFEHCIQTSQVYEPPKSICLSVHLDDIPFLPISNIPLILAMDDSDLLCILINLDLSMDETSRQIYLNLDKLIDKLLESFSNSPKWWGRSFIIWTLYNVFQKMFFYSLDTSLYFPDMDKTLCEPEELYWLNKIHVLAINLI